MAAATSIARIGPPAFAAYDTTHVPSERSQWGPSSSTNRLTPAELQRKRSSALEVEMGAYGEYGDTPMPTQSVSYLAADAPGHDGFRPVRDSSAPLQMMVPRPIVVDQISTPSVGGGENAVEALVSNARAGGGMYGQEVWMQTMHEWARATFDCVSCRRTYCVKLHELGAWNCVMFHDVALLTGQRVRVATRADCRAATEGLATWKERPIVPVPLRAYQDAMRTYRMAPHPLALVPNKRAAEKHRPRQKRPGRRRQRRYYGGRSQVLFGQGTGGGAPVAEGDQPMGGDQARIKEHFLIHTSHGVVVRRYDIDMFKELVAIAACYETRDEFISALKRAYGEPRRVYEYQSEVRGAGGVLLFERQHVRHL